MYSFFYRCSRLHSRPCFTWSRSRFCRCSWWPTSREISGTCGQNPSLYSRPHQSTKRSSQNKKERTLQKRNKNNEELIQWIIILDLCNWYFCVLFFVNLKISSDIEVIFTFFIQFHWKLIMPTLCNGQLLNVSFLQGEFPINSFRFFFSITLLSFGRWSNDYPN